MCAATSAPWSARTAATCFRIRRPSTWASDPQWLYTVRFDGPELWGPDSDPTVSVSVEAFEPYLEPAPEHV